MESSATTVLCQNETVSGGPWTFTRKDHRSKTNAETVGLDLDLTFHQDDLEGPTLQPAQSEGIGQAVSLRESSPSPNSETIHSSFSAGLVFCISVMKHVPG